MRQGLFHRVLGEGPTRQRRRRITRVLAALALLLSAYLASPWLTLWRLDRALTRNDQATLATLVDLDAVRNALRRTLNKDAGETRRAPSDAFIAWLEQAIRRGGTGALEQEVGLDWVRERLLAHSPPGTGMVPVVTWAFFDDPRHFSVSLGPPDQTPVQVRLGLSRRGWRVETLYY